MGKKLNDRVERILAEFPALQRLARVPDGYRAAAAWALQMLYRGPQEENFRAATKEDAEMLLPVMASALYDHAVMVRAHAAGSLGAFGVQREDALALCDVALSDPEWMVRVGGLDSLVALSGLDSESMEVVKGYLGDSHPEVRRKARALLMTAGMTLPAERSEEVVPVTSYTFE
jgi:HEAT repeat protein